MRYADRLLAALADGGPEDVLDVALTACEASGNLRGRVFDEILELLAEQSPDVRRGILKALSGRYEAADETARSGLLALAALLCTGREGDVLVAERRAQIALLEHQPHWYLPYALDLVRAELEAGRPLTPAVVASVRRSAEDSYRPPAVAELARQLTEPVLNVGEPWADRVLDEVPGLPGGWRRLVALALTARSAKPSAAWEKKGRALLAELGEAAVRERLVSWLGLVGRPRTLPLSPAWDGLDVNGTYDAYNANALRGLAWLLSFTAPHQDSVRTLGALVETSLRKVPGVGPRNPKVANAAVHALSRVEGETGLGELARLATRVTFKGTLKQVEAALEARAAALGLRREEIEELAVPAHGLTEVGGTDAVFGDASVRVVVEGTKAALRWRNAAGRQVKSAPAAVRREHPQELKDLAARVKDIDGTLTALVERFDRQFLADREWAYGAWRERILDHPLTGTVARRLLWTVDGTSCGFADGALRDLGDVPVTAAPGARVRLWHPVERPAEEVGAWREWLERHGVTQPFKQAHREVYLLTDAERRTGTYSNRFAAHILRQHQYHALAAVRGWRDTLRLCVDDTFPATSRDLPPWGLRAEFWVAGEGEWGGDITQTGTYLWLSTDQVRFYPLDAPINEAHMSTGGYRMAAGPGRAAVDPVPLSSVPPLVLSEVLRDVDLFVGVASVGNDPTWQDGGPQGRYRAYWSSYGFGELNESARIRRDLLARLLPRLAVGDRCAIKGRFLQVKGARHSYRIHLGSGNILMSPGDRYLCVVPAGPAHGPDTYLPFDGDRTLSLILSKALMLANDTEITDPAILSQL